MCGISVDVIATIIVHKDCTSGRQYIQISLASELFTSTIIIYNYIAQSVVRWTSTWKAAGSIPTPGKVVSENLKVQNLRP